MRLFKRHPKDASVATPTTGHTADDKVLGQIAARSQLTLPRHWVHYVYCRGEPAARAAATEIEAAGWSIRRVARAARGRRWVVIAEQHDVITSGEAVRGARTFFEGLAARIPGGHYDGWEASVD